MKANTPFLSKVYLERLKASAMRARFTSVPYGMVNQLPLVGLTREAQNADYQTVEPRAHIYISAGIHGNEPAGSLALLRLLSDRWFSPDCNWYLFPLLNPYGMQLKQRENGNPKDVNRDYKLFETDEARSHRDWFEANLQTTKLDLSICLHEDWESKGFYLYEVARDTATAASEEITAATHPIIPIETATEIDGHPAAEGIIRPLAEDPVNLPLDLDTECPEALYLFENYSPLNYIFETPSSDYLEKRISAHCAAIKTAVEQLLATREIV